MELSLRFVLLLVGCFIMIGVGFDIFRRARLHRSIQREQGTNPVPSQQPIEPVVTTEEPMHIEEAQAESVPVAPAEPVTQSSTPRPNVPGFENKTIVLLLTARDEEGVAGDKFYRHLKLHKFHFGEMNLFHRFQLDNGEGELFYSLAQAVEPGNFNIETIEKESFKALAMFFQFGETWKPLEAFELMIKTAKALATALSLDIKNDKGHPLTAQNIEHFREQVREYQRKLLAMNNEMAI